MVMNELGSQDSRATGNWKVKSEKAGITKGGGHKSTTLSCLQDSYIIQKACGRNRKAKELDKYLATASSEAKVLKTQLHLREKRVSTLGFL